MSGSHVIPRERLLEICKTGDVADFLIDQQTRWVGHIVRSSNSRIIKQISFDATRKHKSGTHPLTACRQVANHYLKNGYSTINAVYADLLEKRLPKRTPVAPNSAPANGTGKTRAGIQEGGAINNATTF